MRLVYNIGIISGCVNLFIAINGKYDMPNLVSGLFCLGMCLIVGKD